MALEGWQELLKRLDAQTSESEYAKTAHAAGKQGESNSRVARRVLATLAERAVATDGSQSKAPVDACLWALARHRFRPRPAVLGTLAARAKKELSQPSSLANALWGLARLSFRVNASDAAVFATSFGARWHTATPAEASMAAYALASIVPQNAGCIPGVERVAWAVEHCAHLLTAQGVANCLWALNKLNQPAAVAELGVQVPRIAAHLTPQGAANASGALASVACHNASEDSDPKHALQHLLQSCADYAHMPAQDTASLLWALAQLECSINRHFPGDHDLWVNNAAKLWLHSIAHSDTNSWQVYGRALTAARRLGVQIQDIDIEKLLHKGKKCCALATHESKRFREWVASNIARYVNTALCQKNRGVCERQDRWFLLMDFRSCQVQDALHRHGIAVQCLQRSSRKRKRGSVWPTSSQESAYDGCIIRLALSREAAMLQAASASLAVREDGTLYIVGTVKEGVHGAMECAQAQGFVDTCFRSLQGNLGVVYARKPSKGIETTQCRGPDSFCERGIVTFQSGDEHTWRATLRTYPGLFSGGLLDAMTELLLQAISERASCGVKSALDICCGSGVVPAYISHLLPEATFRAVDNDALAVAAAQSNVEACEVHNIDIVNAPAADCLAGRHYNLITANPPLHDHLQDDFAVLFALPSIASNGLKKRRGQKEYRPQLSMMLVVVQDYVPLPAFFGREFQLTLAIADGKFAVWQVMRTP